MRRIAILIGNACFPKGSGLANLKFPAADVNALSAILSDPDVGRFDKIITLIDKSSDEVRCVLDDALGGHEPGTLFLIFYSGHGTVSESGKLYLATRNSEERRRPSTALPFAELINMKDTYGHSRVAVVLDCCFSGQAEKDVKGAAEDQLNAIVGGKGIFFLGASDATQQAKEDDKLGHGVLTAAILDGLSSGNADRDEDGSVSGSDLYKHCVDFVSRHAKHHPYCINKSVGGELILGFSSRRGETEVAAQANDRNVDRTKSGRGVGNSATVRGQPHNLPFLSLGELFKGRGPFLENVHATLSRTTDGQPTAVSGLGGVGKTRLAVEYAWRCGMEYSALLFVPAETPELLNTGLAKLSGTLGLPEQDSHDAKVGVAIEWLEQHERWLIILDNVDDAEAAAAVEELLPRLGRGHVLITGRHPNFSAAIETLELDVLDQHDAAAFLLERTQRRRKPAADDQVIARELADELGGLALQLTQAAAYVCEVRGGTLAHYLALWRDKREKVIEWFGGKAVAYNRNVGLAASLSVSVEKLTTAGRHLLERVAFLSPEPIPEQLLDMLAPEPSDGFDTRRALADLFAYSLATPFEAADGEAAEPAFAVHRLVQDVVRLGVLRDKEVAAFRLEEAAKCIEAALEGASYTSVRPLVVPHAVSILHFMRMDEFRDIGATDLFEKLAQRVIYALLESGREKISPLHLASVFREYYEVEPLFGAIVEFIRRDPNAWKSKIEPSLLKENNYVLRYAMAAALAHTCNDQPSKIADVEARFMRAEELQELEMSGFALALIYLDKPNLIRSFYLDKLANSDCYAGPSIIGYMLLNLVLQVDLGQWLQIRRLITSERFWKSKWDFIEGDVCEIEAAEAFIAKRTIPASAEEEVKECYANLIFIKDNVENIKAASTSDAIRQLLARYFSLGQEPTAIRTIASDLEKSPMMLEIVRLLFSHPIWNVTEEAASVLASLIDKDRKYLRIIEELQKDDSWRVKYGAIETAFCIYSFSPETFSKILYDAVHEFYCDEDCCIRGLCAENLISIILTAGADKRQNLIKDFEKEIRYWLHDEDCWVLEHVFRLFQTLYRKKVDFESLLSQGVSRLFEDDPNWYQLDRHEFLRHIEQRKEAIVAEL